MFLDTVKERQRRRIFVNKYKLGVQQSLGERFVGNRTSVVRDRSGESSDGGVNL